LKVCVKLILASLRTDIILLNNNSLILSTSTSSSSPVQKKLNFEKIAQAFFILGLIFIFFPIRYVFPTKEAFQTGAYSDFTSISLYLSDIFLFVSFIFILPRGIPTFFHSKWLILTAFWLILITLIGFDHHSNLNWFFLAKYIEFFLVAYGTASILVRDTPFRLNLLKIFVFLGTFESVLGIYQFIIQKSVGLNRLGEQIIAPNLTGIAKIIVNGKEFIRSYGTFPHPNLLSAFIFTTIILNIYLLIKAQAKPIRLVPIVSLLINVFGLILTFSRASYLALLVSLIILVGAFVYKRIFNKKVLSILAILTGGLILSIVILRPFFLTRATISDDASLERIFYAKIGVSILKTHPIIGDGLGQSVLDMQKYSPIKLWPWQIQPVHNYFLLAAVEMGLIGVILLIIFFLIHVKQLLQSITKNKEGDMEFRIILLCIFAGFLVLMQFDHYFYTIEQTQLLLWIILGMIGAEVLYPI
jgi:O-antigen ligase